MNARLKDPPLSMLDAISWLDVQLREGGSLDFPNWAIYFDEDWQEDTGFTGKEPGTVQVEHVPSFVLHRVINGRVKKTAHGSLMEALREVEE